MRKILLIISAIFAVLSASAAVHVIPQPVSVQEGKGCFSITKGAKIDCADESLLKSAEIFAADMNTVLGVQIPVAVNNGGNITLSIDATLGKEEYKLTVTKKKIAIVGGSSAGVFYGFQTLKQLLKDGNIPAVTIEDKPHFAYRGTHLDVARHFFTAEEVKKYIDILALHKINRFHWHLTDDQGWRIEIKKHPALVEKGSMRKETLVGKSKDKYDGIPHGGYYTQEEIKDVVAYAADRHIEIVPEVDLPGHMQAALAAYPELGCTGGPYEMRCKWGISKDVLCAGNEKVYDFLEDVLAEICELFPSKLIHIGGDECPKDTWKTCPKCQDKIKALGLKDDRRHQAEHYLQNYVMGRVEKFLNEKGRRIIGWDEILEGNATKTATVMIWRDHESVVKAVRRGNDVIIATRHHCYLDYYQTSDPKSEPLSIGGRYMSMQQVYRLEPYDRLYVHERNRVVGVQANLWTEYIKDFESVQAKLLPRLAALSETAWAYDRKKEYKTFADKAKSLLPDLYKSYGYNYATYFFEGIE